MPPLSALKDVIEVPDAVVAAVERAMSWAPEERFESVSAFVEAMEQGVPDTLSAVTPGFDGEVSDWTSGVDSQKSPMVMMTAVAPSSMPREAIPTTELVDAPGKGRGLYMGLAAAGIIAVGLVYGLQNSSEGSAQTEAAKAGVHPNSTCSASMGRTADSLRGDRGLALDTPLSPLPTSISVALHATYKGVVVKDLVLLIDNAQRVNANDVMLPIGETAVRVERVAGLVSWAVPSDRIGSSNVPLATPSIPSWNQLYDWLKPLDSVRQVAVDTGYMEAKL